MSRLLGVLGVGEVDVRDQVGGQGVLLSRPADSSPRLSRSTGTIDLIGKLSVKKKMLFKNLKKCSSFMEFMSTPPPLFSAKIP